MIKIIDKQDVAFAEVMQLIDSDYRYKPTSFTNGVESDCVFNAAGQNEGSCKLFAFAKIHGLSKEQTLLLFGEYYRDDVLNHPEGDDHANIRTFMKYGWDGIKFDGEPLVYG